MATVTISGQFGTGAREIGRAVAAQLKLDYVDQEILVDSASALGVPVESVVTHDERTTGLGERVGAMLRRFLERSAVASGLRCVRSCRRRRPGSPRVDRRCDRGRIPRRDHVRGYGRVRRMRNVARDRPDGERRRVHSEDVRHDHRPLP